MENQKETRDFVEETKIQIEPVEQETMKDKEENLNRNQKKNTQVDDEVRPEYFNAYIPKEKLKSFDVGTSLNVNTNTITLEVVNSSDVPFQSSNNASNMQVLEGIYGVLAGADDKISRICSQRSLPSTFRLEDLKVLDQFIAEKGKNYLFEKSPNWYNIYYTVTSQFRKQENLEITFNRPKTVETVTVRAEAEDKVPKHMIDYKKDYLNGPYAHLFLTSAQIPKGTHLIKKVKFEGDLYDQGSGPTSYAGLLCYTITPEISFYDDLMVIDRFDTTNRDHTVVFDGLNMLRAQKVPIEDSRLEIYLNAPPFPGFSAETKGFTLTLTLVKNEYI